MVKRLIVPPNGPQAVGPYSPAVEAHGFLFISGQIPLNPGNGELVTEPFEAQVKQTLENLKTILESAGATLLDVVKVTIYLDDINNFSALNTVYEEYFNDSKPARACVEVSKLPKGVAVEMDAIAIMPDSKP